jgi:hypothetical protein
LQHQLLQLVQVLGFNSIQVALDRADPVAEGATPQSRMKFPERIDISHRAGGRELLLPIAFLEFGDRGKPDQMILNGWSEVPEQGQELPSDAIAEEAGVFIGGILPPFEALTRKVLANRHPRHSQQWPEEAGFGSGQNAAETGRSGAAEEAEEDGFGLVGGGVTGCHPVDDTRSPPLGEEPEAGLTARLL